MLSTYNKLISANGYYCNMCDTYHDNEEMKHRYFVETVGEWNGQPANDFRHEIICPECGHGDELENFNYLYWSHLRAYHLTKDVPMTFKYPLFDRETNGPTTGYDETPSVDELEKLADWYCIEVEKVEEINGEIVITVEFC